MAIWLSFKYIIFLIILVNLKHILCICEKCYIVICDDLKDPNDNDTTSWRHVQIGSSSYRPQRNLEILTTQILFAVNRVKSLTIINRINGIRPLTTLGSGGSLEYFNLYGNTLLEIEDYTFENWPRIREIYLMNNKIQHLGQAIFKNTTLEVVNLSRNRIKSITTCFYKTKIKWILLNHNNIDFIRSEAFPNNLEQLELSYNSLSSLEDHVFRNLKQLKELFMEGNRLTTVPDIRNLKEIRFLHFAYNNIRELHYPFNQHNKKIEYMDFSSNLIKNVTVDVFTGVSSPPLVLLNYNKLTNIVIRHPEKKTDLSFYGNPWNCNCLFETEKILVQYKHMKTCEIDFFDKGNIPLCLETGPCGITARSESETFFQMVKVYEKSIKDYCHFRL